MQDPFKLIIGLTTSDHVCITVLGRERPAATDVDDGNWLNASIAIQSGSWRGKYLASLRAEDFRLFRDQLMTISQSPGRATFLTMEDWIQLFLDRNKAGQIEVSGRAIDSPGIGNSLSFRFRIDQTFLPAMLNQLLAIEDSFPAFVSDSLTHSKGSAAGRRVAPVQGFSLSTGTDYQGVALAWHEAHLWCATSCDS